MAHALYSPSHAAIWSVCTASVGLEKTMPDSGSAYAAEGTLAHAVAELKVRHKYTGMTDDEYRQKLDALKADPLYQNEMDGHTDAYIEEIDKVCLSSPSIPYVVAERHLEMGHIVPDCFGTADCIVLIDDALHVFDFKYGKGVPVNAENNPQLRLYALGAVHEYSVFNDIKTVVTHIVQPRLDNIQSEELLTGQLAAWGLALRKKMLAAINGDVQFAPGEHCRFCKAKTICRARAVEMLSLEEPMQRAETLTDEEIGGILVRAIMLESWVKDLKDYTQETLKNGGDIPGWKLVEGRSNRIITDIEKAFKLLAANGYADTMLYKREPLGLTELEKLVGKKHLSDIIGEYIVKPAGKPTLAEESDKRRAISKKKFEEMFSEKR